MVCGQQSLAGHCSGLLVVWEKLLFLFLLFLLRRELIVQALFESCALANL